MKNVTVSRGNERFQVEIIVSRVKIHPENKITYAPWLSGRIRKKMENGSIAAYVC